MAVLYGRFVVPSTAGGVRLPSGRWLPEQVLGRKVVAKTRADGSVAEPIAAFDVTFSPSKSVSVLWGLTGDEKVRRTVLEAHETAVAAGLAYLDETAGHTRAGDGGVRKIAGDGFVIAQFRHRSSRSTDPATRVGDPQLHSHCAILNRIRGVDGKWRTLDSRAIYRHAHAAGAVYGADAGAGAVAAARGVVGDTGAAGADARDRRCPGGSDRPVLHAPGGGAGDV